MTRKHVRVKSVHFNTNKEDDYTMLKAIARRNFSKYVKQLIKEDIERKKELPNKQPNKKGGGITYLPKET